MRVKFVFSTLIAALLLSVGAGGAAARSFEVSEQRVTGTSRGMVFESSSGNVTCDVTRVITLHRRTFAKVANTLIGYVTDVRATNCTERSTGALTETLPWHVTYGGFSGTLPRITEMRLNVLNVTFLFTIFGVSCLFAGTGEGRLAVSAGSASTLRLNEAVAFNLAAGGFFCPRTYRMRGTLNLSPILMIRLL